jgi:hypothetical protein
MYYNTTHLDGDNLRKAERQTETQEEMIYEYFRSCGGPLAPHHVHQAILPNAPLTSVRRAITNLASAGKLFKTDYMVRGTYGKPSHTWALTP